MTCPECGSKKLWKDGLRYQNDGSTVQRWLCRTCGFRFSQPNVKVNVTTQSLKSPKSRPDLPNVNIARRKFPIEKCSDSLSFQTREDVGSHNVSVVAKPINSFRVYTRDCRVCASREEAKNLNATEQKQTVAGEKSTQQGKIIEYAWKLKKRNLSDNTIKIRTYQLNQLANKGANLNDPDSVETILATEHLTASQKSKLVAAYSSYTKTMGIQWQPIKVNYKPKEPFIPLETELDQLIARCGKKTAAYLQVLKDT